ncbi:hypothetical protein BDV97DRAFT_425248 [Delphinella strobiligena]|nr:hypothetical protein BDV97DRAFT_425248 [Delphinella strobiligena]
MSASEVIDIRAQIAANVEKLWPEEFTMIMLKELEHNCTMVAQVRGYLNTLLESDVVAAIRPEQAYRSLLQKTEQKLEETSKIQQWIRDQALLNPQPSPTHSV